MYDVVVVGGGPIGLAFVCALAGSGLRLALVERHAQAALATPPDDGREIALTHRSVDILRTLGAWARLDPAAVAPLRRARVLNGGSPFALSFDPAERNGDPLGHIVANHDLRRALFDCVADQPNLELRTDCVVAGVRTARSGAVVTLADGRALDARLVIAADSRLSAVRAQLGIAAQINRLGRSMMVCRVVHNADHGGIATEWFDHGQTIALLPLGGRMSSVVLTLPTAAIDRMMARDAETLGAELTRRSGGKLGTMRVAGRPHAYPLATTYARHFAAPRAALIGDAAVGMHPVTAHGFNLGLQGQASLARLIGAAAARGQDIAAPSLLRRYEAGYRLATRPLYAATNLLVGLYTDERPAARLARHIGLRAGAGLPLVRDIVTGMLMQRAAH